jgi:hypothetical protein
VRMEQLIDNFYAKRMSEERGMGVLWKAGSKHQAFASLDPEEAKIWSHSTVISGPVPGSILGKRRHG